MKKNIIVIVGLVVIIGITAYWLGARQQTNTNTVNTNATSVNNDSRPTNTNIQPDQDKTLIQVTYQPYLGASTKGFIFDTIKEWTSVAPEEIVKNYTTDQLYGYTIDYYAVNAAGAGFNFSTKASSDTGLSLSQIVNQDITNITRLYADAKVIKQNAELSNATTVITASLNGNIFTVNTQYLLLPATSDGLRWAKLGVTVPDSSKSKYVEVVSRLLGSLKEAP